MQSTTASRSGRSVRRRLSATSVAALTLCLGAAVETAAGTAARADDATTAAPVTPANPDAAAPDYGARVADLLVTAPPNPARAAVPAQAPLPSTEPTSIV